MEESKIEPHKITKPFQLLAAWLVGLILVNLIFLTSAAKIDIDWLKASLIVASIINVPLFLISIFILQTKFRPEMQEDLYYSQYLDKKSQKIKIVPTLLRRRQEMSPIATEKNTSSRPKTITSGKILYSISINDHIPDFQKIRQKLREEQFKVTEIFGEIDGTYKPDKFIIFISNAINDVVFIKVKCFRESWTFWAFKMLWFPLRLSSVS